ncbi:hypothetical protein B296_00044509 [Ensete ventricosum]|uniref:Uncharacterized protein n=1 Tax=Ensete ventricosum TaxID=4639 RepID=A0A426X4D6_ENSVE|nr:hypothetical protein B296_00044509 [Ensete ventricosum]
MGNTTTNTGDTTDDSSPKTWVVVVSYDELPVRSRSPSVNSQQVLNHLSANSWRIPSKLPITLCELPASTRSSSVSSLRTPDKSPITFDEFPVIFR